MKKLLILLFILVGCQNKEIVQTRCISSLDDPIKIDRVIDLFSDSNKLVKLQTSDKLYFSEEFSKEMYEELFGQTLEKYADFKNLKIEDEVFDDYAILSITILDTTVADFNELRLVGLEKIDEELNIGVSGSINLNKDFVCEVVDVD